MRIDPEMIIRIDLSLEQGAIRAGGWSYDGSYTKIVIDGLAEHYNFSVKTPFKIYRIQRKTYCSTVPTERNSDLSELIKEFTYRF